MDTEIDWRREIDASFGSGTDAPVGAYVAAGHRAVRRRRATLALAGVATAAVVAGTAWAVAPSAGGDPSRSDAPVATDPSGRASTEGTTDAMPWTEDGPPAALRGDSFAIRPGAVVHERRDDLFPGKAGDSVALDISYGGERWWMTLEWDGGGASTASVKSTEGLYDTFDAFVAAEVQAGGMTSEPGTERDLYDAGLVKWQGDELLTWPGVTVVRRVEDPVRGADSLGLVLREKGVTTWMLITRDGTGQSTSSTKESESGAATFDQWLAEFVALAESDLAQGSGQPDGPQQPVELAADGTVRAALPGVEVLGQQADPDLRAYGTEAAGASSALAQFEWKGARWFAFLLDDQVTVVAQQKAGGATTLPEFEAFLANRADEGGMR